MALLEWMTNPEDGAFYALSGESLPARLGGSGFLPPIVGAGGAQHDAGHAEAVENHHQAHMSPLELALQRKKASRKRRGKRSPAPY